MTRLMKVFALAALALSGPATALAQSTTVFSLDLEGGMAFSGYNRIQGSNEGDRLFNAYRELSKNPKPYYRIRPTLSLGRHNFSALFAPLRLRYTGDLSSSTAFEGQTYSADRLVNLDYKLNSYRLTYRYNLFNSERFIAGLGLTAKFNDYFVQIQDGSLSTRESAFGFQPLLNLYVNGWLTDHFGILLEGDAFGTRDWRTEDVFLGVTYRPFQNLTFKGGYRLMEGGSSLRDLYNFSLINYLGGGVIISL